MASRKGGGGKVVDLTVEILREIRDALGGTNERLERLEKTTNDRFQRLETRLERLEVATVKGFKDLRSRLDNLLDFAGERYRDHEERIRTLEQRVLRGQ
ncbi:MAG: hypothetical protein HYY06_12000 [Deltaproteobacteria bacterium]|nr:hypothetical protein [Deltaproteobacteria bacterium]